MWGCVLNLLFFVPNKMSLYQPVKCRKWSPSLFISCMSACVFLTIPCTNNMSITEKVKDDWGFLQLSICCLHFQQSWRQKLLKLQEKTRAVRLTNHRSYNFHVLSARPWHAVFKSQVSSGVLHSVGSMLHYHPLTRKSKSNFTAASQWWPNCQVVAAVERRWTSNPKRDE